LKKFPKKIMSYFLQGLLALLPLFITIFLVSALFGFIERRVGYFLFLIPEQYRTVKLIAVFTEISTAIVLFILIVLFGLTIKTLWGKVIVKKIDQALSSIPGISGIYKASRQVIELLTMDKDASLMKPVLVEYPSSGIWTIGFNTGEVSGELKPSEDGRYFTVFIPTTPNPTSGFLMIFSESHIRPLSMPMETALKMVLTGGMVKSEKEKQ
jgi:uncharacterized membrane protein